MKVYLESNEDYPIYRLEICGAEPEGDKKWWQSMHEIPESLYENYLTILAAWQDIQDQLAKLVEE